MILCCIDAITHISFVFSPIKVFQIKHIIIVNFNYTVQLPFQHEANDMEFRVLLTTDLMLEINLQQCQYSR